jgi:hypothetical protein
MAFFYPLPAFSFRERIKAVITFTLWLSINPDDVKACFFYYSRQDLSILRPQGQQQAGRIAISLLVTIIFLCYHIR